MQTIDQAGNPFAMMLDPQAIIDAMDRSALLSSLHRQVFRPLDKPLPGGRSVSVQAWDEAIDYEAELDD